MFLSLQTLTERLFGQDAFRAHKSSNKVNELSIFFHLTLLSQIKRGLFYLNIGDKLA